MTLDPLFCDGLILQAGKPIRVFGEGGGHAEVTLAGKTAGTDTRSARWEVELPPMPYGGPYEMTVKYDGRETILRDVMLGDVFLAAGQSNMQFRMRDTGPLPETGDDGLRLFACTRVEGGEAFGPQDGWVRATPETVPGFSSVAYQTAAAHRKATGHAVGIVTCYQGAAAIQCFLAPSTFAAHPEFILPVEQRFDMDYEWNADLGGLYTFGLGQIAPFAVGCVLWYQGESNCSEAEAPLYAPMLRCLLADWREALRDGTLPFVIFRIHDFTPRDFPAWHTIQDAQAEVAGEDAYARLVETRFVCEHDLIHPLKKTEISLAAAKAAGELMGL